MKELKKYSSLKYISVFESFKLVLKTKIFGNKMYEKTH